VQPLGLVILLQFPWHRNFLLRMMATMCITDFRLKRNRPDGGQWRLKMTKITLEPNRLFFTVLLLVLAPVLVVSMSTCISNPFSTHSVCRTSFVAFDLVYTLPFSVR
jgi:hypothetical protein